MLKATVLAGLIALTRAHMKFEYPVPYGNKSLATMRNGPLEPDGSDFPCRGYKPSDGTPEGQKNTAFAQGSKQQLKLIGSAVHGGGSCQISLTTDTNPTKNSVWKVIKSIEGGCPAKNLHDNITPGNSELKTPYQYDFTVPKDLPPGDYGFAWTWFNNIGNREMYMTCAIVSVTGSGGDKAYLDSLPNMFIANVPALSTCATKENTDLKFPNPGKDVDNFNDPKYTLLPPQNCPKETAGPQPTGGSPAGGSQPAPQPSTSNSLPGGVFVTQPASQPAPSSPPVGNAPSSPPAPAPTSNTGSAAPSSAPSTGTGGGSGGAGFAAGTACTSEGSWNCIGGTSFQRCAAGVWTKAQGVASGTVCAPGESSELKVTHGASKPSRRGLRYRLRFTA